VSANRPLGAVALASLPLTMLSVIVTALSQFRIEPPFASLATPDRPASDPMRLSLTVVRASVSVPPAVDATIPQRKWQIAVDARDGHIGRTWESGVDRGGRRRSISRDDAVGDRHRSAAAEVGVGWKFDTSAEGESARLACEGHEFRAGVGDAASDLDIADRDGRLARGRDGTTALVSVANWHSRGNAGDCIGNAC
jgi:hypothetical protein